MSCIQLEFLRGVRKLEANGGTNLHYVLMSIPSQVGAVNESVPALPLTEVATSTFFIVFDYVLRLQNEIFKHLKVYSRFTAMCVVPCHIFEAVELRGQLYHFVVNKVKTVDASGASIGTYST